jgi:hypothetical protein
VEIATLLDCPFAHVLPPVACLPPSKDAHEMGQAQPADNGGFAMFALAVLHAFVKRLCRLDFATRFRNTGLPGGDR